MKATAKKATTRKRKRKNKDFVRLTVQCGDDLRFFDVRVPKLQENVYRDAVTKATASFARVLNEQ
jgi:hypothetical protein